MHDNTQLSKQVNTSQHESTRARHELTRLNKNQLDQDIGIVYRNLLGKV